MFGLGFGWWLGNHSVENMVLIPEAQVAKVEFVFGYKIKSILWN